MISNFTPLSDLVHRIGQRTQVSWSDGNGSKTDSNKGMGVIIALRATGSSSRAGDKTTAAAALCHGVAGQRKLTSMSGRCGTYHDTGLANPTAGATGIYTLTYSAPAAAAR